MNKLKYISSAITLATILSSCATIIGGFTSTKSSSGSSYGPATLSSGDTSLSHDKLTALTIESGDLTLNDFAIQYKLSVYGDLTVTDSKLRGVTQVGGGMLSNNTNFYQSCGILGNVVSNGSYFAKDLEFAGNSLDLNQKSKIVGNIISSSSQPVIVTIDNSYVKGNIGFVNSNSVVIIKNKGYVKGQIINAKVEDLTGGDSYGGDDDFKENELKE